MQLFIDICPSFAVVVVVQGLPLLTNAERGNPTMRRLGKVEPFLVHGIVRHDFGGGQGAGVEASPVYSPAIV